MIRAMFMVMFRQLTRDKGSLILTFALPPVIFTVLAAIFSNASSGDLDLSVAMATQSEAPVTLKVAEGLSNSEAFELLDFGDNAEGVFSAVKTGDADAGVIFLNDLADTQNAQINIVVEPSRDVASLVLAGAVQEQLAEHFPQKGLVETVESMRKMVGGFSPGQQARIDAALAGLSGAEKTDTNAIIERVSALGDAGGPVLDPATTYYTGATAILFLLFSSMHSASILLTERAQRIPHRLFLKGWRTFKFSAGKFAFLTAQGTLQSLVIFAIAELLFDVPVLANLLLIILASGAMAACASGLALFVTSACQSEAQARTASTFLVLISSAVGGSMVPRFMMPDWLQSAGFLTPNAWAIETVYSILARGQGLRDLLPGFGILFGSGMVALLLATWISSAKLKKA